MAGVRSDGTRNTVIVVDMLKGFCNMGNLANPRTARIIPNIKKLLEQKVLKAGWGVIFLKDCHKPNDKEFGVFPPHCIKGTKETEIVDELQPLADYWALVVIEKTRYSGFFKTGLEDILSLWCGETGEIIVVGVCSDICVLHTVADLRNRDYNVTVLEDCVETFDAPGHSAEGTNQWALRHMSDILGAKIKKLQEVI